MLYHWIVTEIPEFIPPQLWLPDLPDLNLVDNIMWEIVAREAVQNMHHWSGGINATHEWLAQWWHDPTWHTPFSIAASVHPDYPSLVITRFYVENLGVLHWTQNLPIFRWILWWHHSLRAHVQQIWVECSGPFVIQKFMCLSIAHFIQHVFGMKWTIDKRINFWITNGPLHSPKFVELWPTNGKWLIFTHPVQFLHGIQAAIRLQLACIVIGLVYDTIIMATTYFSNMVHNCNYAIFIGSRKKLALFLYMVL